MSERSITASILKHLRGGGAFAEKIHAGGHRIGFPDIVACVEGRFVALEVKRPGYGASGAQQAVLDEIRQAGGVAGIVTSAVEVDELWASCAQTRH